MKLGINEAYFHDGAILNIVSQENNLDLWMESSELEEEWPTDFKLTVNKTIRGILHVMNIKKIEINNNLYDGKLAFIHDEGEILKLEIKNNKICLLNIIWSDFSPKSLLNKFETIRIEAENYEWENIPDLKTSLEC
jgi:hypothetical protein